MSQQTVLERPALNESIYSRVASLVNLIASPVSAEQAMTREIYGLSWLESLASLNPDGSWAKMCQGYCQVRLDGSLEEFSETWPRWGIVLDGVCMVPRMLERHTDETESLLWRTPDANLGARGPKSWETYVDSMKHGTHAVNLMDQVRHGPALWATPNTMDALPQRSPEALLRQATTTRKGRTRPANLREQVDERVIAMWPTPHANCHTGAGEHGTGGLNIQTAVQQSQTGQLNPDWVECLMGFPIGWTSIDGQPDSEKSNTIGSRQESQQALNIELTVSSVSEMR
jgi:hypothetical protein